MPSLDELGTRILLSISAATLLIGLPTHQHVIISSHLNAFSANENLLRKDLSPNTNSFSDPCSALSAGWSNSKLAIKDQSELIQPTDTPDWRSPFLAGLSPQWAFHTLCQLHLRWESSKTGSTVTITTARKRFCVQNIWTDVLIKEDQNVAFQRLSLYVCI